MVKWLEQYEIIKAKISQRLAEGGKNYSAVNAAELLGASRGRVRAWETGQRPSADDLESMSEILGLSPAWLLLGEGEPVEKFTIRRLAPNAPHEPACVIGPDDETPVGHVVPVYGMSAAGNALDRWEPEPIAHVCIPLTYYKESVLIVQVEGRSMEPEIRHGAFVGIDTAQKDYVAGERYGLRVPYEGLTIKQLFIDPAAGLFRLRSVNPEHPEIQLPIEDREDIIVGKAIWVLQSI